MDIKLVRQLAEIMNEEGLKNVEITDGQMTVKVERDLSMHVVSEKKIIKHAAPVTAPVVPPVAPVLPEPIVATSTKQTQSEQVPNCQKFEVRSPIVGKFMSSYDGNPVYVTIGSPIKKGDVLCVIEAGRHFNEITSDVDGVIRDILVRDGDKVKFDQILFKVEQKM